MYNRRMSSRESNRPTIFLASEALARQSVPMAFLGILLVPIAAISPAVASAAFGASVAGFAIYQIVRWVNRRVDPRTQMRDGG